MGQENEHEKTEGLFDLDKGWNDIKEELKIEEERKRKLKGKRRKMLRRMGLFFSVLWVLIAVFDLAATSITFIIGFIAVIMLSLGGFLS